MAAQGQAQKVTYATQPALKTQFLTTPISQAQKLAGSQQVQTQIQVRAGGAAGGGVGLGPSQPLAPCRWRLPDSPRILQSGCGVLRSHCRGILYVHSSSRSYLGNPTCLSLLLMGVWAAPGQGCGYTHIPRALPGVPAAAGLLSAFLAGVWTSRSRVSRSTGVEDCYFVLSGHGAFCFCLFCIRN